MSSIFIAVRTPILTECLEGRSGCAIAATDYLCAYADQIRASIPQRYTVTGMGGFGRLDNRVTLRRFFEVAAHAATATLAAEGKMNAKDVARALKEYKIDAEKANPIGV